MNRIVEGVIWYAVFVFSTTCHEAAHALLAKRGGDTTAYLGGQVSLNPWPHIRREPFGMVLFPIVSFLLGGFLLGWASTPYSPAWAMRYPRRAGLMSLAGPTTNLLLALLAGVAIRLGLLLGAFEPPPEFRFGAIVAATTAGGALVALLGAILSVMLSLNLLLFLFNLIPLPPLDGFGVVPIFLSPENGRLYMMQAAEIRRIAIFGMILAWKILPYIFRPTFGLALRILYFGQG